MTLLDHSNATPRYKKPSPRLLAYFFYIAGVLAAILAAAVLVTAQAQPQRPVQAEQAQATDSNVKARYSIGDIARAFGFIDTNQDGKMSRLEASGFRNIAKYFDAADADQDGYLSMEEFGSALNRP